MFFNDKFLGFISQLIYRRFITEKYKIILNIKQTLLDANNTKILFSFQFQFNLVKPEIKVTWEQNFVENNNCYSETIYILHENDRDLLVNLSMKTNIILNREMEASKVKWVNPQNYTKAMVVRLAII